jgi:hypothetical protein
MSLDDAFLALCLGTSIPPNIPLPVEAGNKHRTTVFFTPRLVGRYDWGLVLLGRDVS